MRYLRKNTAVIVTVGPFFDKTDGVTLETALTITNERISLVVDADDGNAPTLVLDNVTGATSGTSNDLNYITNCDAGLMQLELAAANVNYNGRAFLTITDAANHVPVFHEFEILPANVYDSLISGSDSLEVDATALSGDTTAADNAESFFDGTGYAGTNNVIPTVTNLTNAATNGDLTATMKTSVTTAATSSTPTVTTGTISANAINAAAIATGAITNAKFAAGAIDAAAIANAAIDAATFAAGAIDATAIANGAIDAATFAAGAIDAAAIANGAIDAATFAADVDAEAAAWIWGATDATLSLTYAVITERLYRFLMNKMLITDATGAVALRNEADNASLATQTISDDDTTTTRTALSWS